MVSNISNVTSRMLKLSEIQKAKYNMVVNFIRENVNKDTPMTHEELKELMEKAKRDPVLNNNQILIVQEYTRYKDKT